MTSEGCTSPYQLPIRALDGIMNILRLLVTTLIPMVRSGPTASSDHIYIRVEGLALKRGRYDEKK